MEPDKTDLWRDPRVYLAAERTFLAWLRTGLALMGFGFVVARFGLLLFELSAQGARPLPSSGTASTRFGTTLVLIGVVVTIASSVRYKRMLSRLDRGDDLREPSWLAIGVAAFMALAGVLASLHLLGLF